MIAQCGYTRKPIGSLRVHSASHAMHETAVAPRGDVTMYSLPLLPLLSLPHRPPFSPSPSTSLSLSLALPFCVLPSLCLSLPPSLPQSAQLVVKESTTVPPTLGSITCAATPRLPCGTSSTFDCSGVATRRFWLG